MSELASVAKAIKNLYPTLEYDHRPFMTYVEKHAHIRERDATEAYRINYACFKYAVAAVIKPCKIIEVGVRGGTSALAFLHAAPKSKYLGIDNGMDGMEYLMETSYWLKKLNFDASLLIADSQTMKSFPSQADLAHVDACHSTEGTYHDVTMAVESKSEWILVDDTNHHSVMFGVLKALDYSSNTLCGFTEVEGGSVLIHNEGHQ